MANKTDEENEKELILKRIGELTLEIKDAEEAGRKAREIEAALAKIDIGKMTSDYESALRNVEELQKSLEKVQDDLKDPLSLRRHITSDKPIPESEILMQILAIKKDLESDAREYEQKIALKKDEIGDLEEKLGLATKMQAGLAVHQKMASRLGALTQEKEKLSGKLESLKPAKQEPEAAQKKGKRPAPPAVRPSTEEKAAEERVRLTRAEQDVLNDYAALLRAKQRWRNLVTYKEGSNGKFRGFVRRTLKVGARKKAGEKVDDAKGLRDDYFLAREKDIGEKFAKLVDDRVAAAGNGGEKKAAVETIYKEVAGKFAKGRGRLDRALMWLRKPAGMAVRIGLGVGLGAVAFATGGWAAAVLGLTIYGIASRYLLVDGMWDRIHHLYTGRAKKKEYGMAAQLFYNNAKKISAVGDKVYADASKISGKALNEASLKYAHNLARNRFWKKLLAVAYAVLPPVVSGSVANLFVSQKAAVPAVESATEAAKTAVVQPPIQDIYTVPKGGGIWHICKAIAHDKLPGFDNLSVADQNIAIDAMKDAVVADPAKYGLEPSEIIPRALDRGGPWLKLGADMHAKDLVSAVPKRLIDTLGLGKNAITAAGIKAAVKGAVSHGDISKAVAIGHSVKR